MKMDDSKLVKHIFNYDYGICQNNWSADMKYIVSMFGMSDEKYKNKKWPNINLIE